MNRASEGGHILWKQMALSEIEAEVWVEAAKRRLGVRGAEEGRIGAGGQILEGV